MGGGDLPSLAKTESCPKGLGCGVDDTQGIVTQEGTLTLRKNLETEGYAHYQKEKKIRISHFLRSSFLKVSVSLKTMSLN